MFTRLIVLNCSLIALLLFYSNCSHFPAYTVDIQIHDVYYIISYWHIFLVFVGILLLKNGVLFFLRERFKQRKTIRIQLILDVLFLLALFWLTYYIHTHSIPRRYYQFETFETFSNAENRDYSFLLICGYFVFFLCNQLFPLLLFVLHRFNNKTPTPTDVLDQH